MSLSRDGKKVKQQLTSSVIELRPDEPAVNASLPPKARPVSQLFFPNKQQEDAQARKSAHLINIARKTSARNPHTFYHFKNNESGSEISELEAACCGILNFLAPENVPSARAYYDESQNNKFVGLASKNIPGFKSNRDDGLQEKDISIEFREQDIENHRTQLVEHINALMQITDRTSRQQQNSSILNAGLQFSKNFFNYYANSALTAVKFHDDLLAFQKMEGKFTQDTLFQLKKLLLSRKEHIQKDIHNADQYGGELQLIENAVIAADYLFKYTNEIMPDSIEKLERLDKMLRAKGIDLNSLNESKIITSKVFESEFQIKVKSLKNYRIVRGQAIGEIARYIAKDPDGHNRNMSKEGHIIDFDMAKLNLLYRFRNRGLVDRIFRMPTKNSFVVTERDIRFFPDIRDADFFYWPTKQTSVTQSVVDTIPKIFENFFTHHDNEVYKKLANNPVFIFHKFKTLLKYILAGDRVYASIARLHVRAHVTFDDDGVTKNLLDEFIKDEAARVLEIRHVLLHMREFREFLALHGPYAFSLIRDEIIQYKGKYEKKLAAKPYYQELVTSLDLPEMDKKFRELMQVSGAEKINSSRAVPITASMSRR